MKAINISDKHLLKQISFQTPKHGLVAIIGPNGAGKTSLLKVLAGISLPLTGSVYYNDTDLLTISNYERANYIGYLDQHPSVCWDIEIRDLILLGLTQKKVSNKKRLEFLTIISKRLRLDNLIKKSVRELSGGELARVHLARLLIADLPIILIDEPAASLDPYFQIEIMKDLQKQCINRLGLIILHDLNLAIKYCDYFILMQEGRVFVSGDKNEVMTSDNLKKCFSIKSSIDLVKNQIIIQDVY